MNNKKFLRVTVFMFLIFGTLLVSNYYIDYVKITEINEKIITNKFEINNEEMNTKIPKNNLVSGLQAEEIYKEAGNLMIENSDVEEFINENKDLEFFSTTKEINILYDDIGEIPIFEISKNGITNLKKMNNLEKINFEINIDDYYVRKDSSFDYTDEDVEEFSKKAVKEIEKTNKDILEKMETAKIKTNIEVNILEYL